MDSVLFVQHGDYRDAYLRFAEGGSETYRDQRKSVDFVSALAPARRVTTLMLGAREYRDVLAPNLSAWGVRKGELSGGKIADILDTLAVTHLVLRSPHIGFLTEAVRRDIWILPCFADLFRQGGLYQRVRNYRMRRALLQAKAPCVSNHSLNASRSLVSVLGIPPGRIVPWDWSKVPLAGPPKAGVADPSRPTIFFAGAMTEAKGVGDCLEAVALLAKSGLDFTLSLAGGGDLEPWRVRAQSLGVSDRVTFLGVIPNAQVREEMRRHDFVLVSSRHSYAEGLPNTIYEALASRSVLIMSDHPAFRGRLTPDRDCLVFQAAHPEELARCLRTGTDNRQLYETISGNAASAHDQLYVGMEWSALVSSFLADPDNGPGWVEKHSLPEKGH